MPLRKIDKLLEEENAESNPESNILQPYGM